ncbi:hypothetical protein B0A55_06006 [Friedmanniomyces simplex]|uniref:F-box domain-containing protein n=1 Tax=Friedmanniomyces simplex TaxID=329884 RepID=A0A4U0XIQ8_9PEZI|nr:hypothetical protein B0A55_06006 [Friedmanniomyces simplex]
MPPISDSTEEPTFTHLFDLPPEVRDMIYIQWPKVAWVDIAQAHPRVGRSDRQTDKSVNQPTASKVSRRMRKECLDVFYGKNKFLLDLRGWKHSEYPRKWTPLMIFERWISGIGDENAGRLRSLSFLSHNFTAHIRTSNEVPHVSLKFRATPSRIESAEGTPAGYTFDIAARRAEQGLRSLLDRIRIERHGAPLRANDLNEICRFVNMLQPFLCKRSNLGHMGAVLPSNQVEDWPSPDAHTNKCDDCGYHRFTRGQD